MARIEVNCPNCKTSYKVEEPNLGKKGRCKKCQQLFVVQSVNSNVLQINSETIATPAAIAASPKQETRQFATEDQVPAVWQTGDEILDQYVVKGILGEGGMGTVYRVHHKGWNKDLAVKSVKEDLLTQKGAVENFEKEAEMWVNLNLHPHTVSCWYVRRLGGIPRIFAEFVEGGTLQEWIADSQGRTGKLYEGGSSQALERILDIAIQVAWGLHSAHEQGLIHQDVKPANVMMTPDGIAKVTDFGMAKARELTVGATAATRPGHSILVSSGGMTPAYCSPEQANKQSLSRKTDIWSWAVSVLEMFTGDVTWPSGTVAEESLKGYLEVGAGDDRIPKMPMVLAELLRRCFQNDPEARPRDLQDVAESVKEVYRHAIGHELQREKPDPTEALADTLNNRAVSLFDLGKKEEAELTWQEALKVDPHHSDATYNWGLIQWRSGRMTDSKLIEKLREARASSADTARVDYLTGMVQTERTDVQAAIHFLRIAVEASNGRTEIAAALTLAQSLDVPIEQNSRILERHSRSVCAVSWSPDGHFAFSGSEDRLLHLWDMVSGECLRTFKGHTDKVTSVSWSPDGLSVLSASWDHTLRLWEVKSGKCLRIFVGHINKVTSVSWSPDGYRAISVGLDFTLRLWEVASGRCLYELENVGPSTSVSWSPDGRRAIFGEYKKTLKLWGVKSGDKTPEWLRDQNQLCSFVGHTDKVTSVSWSPNGRRVLSGSGDKTLKLWEVDSSKCLRTLAGHTGAVLSVSWSPDGRFALSGSTDNTMRLWEVFSGRCLRTFEGHSNNVNSVSWSPDGRFALSGSEDTTLRIWGITLAKQPIPLVLSMAFTGNLARYHGLIQQVRDSLFSNPIVAVGFLKEARQQLGVSRSRNIIELARPLSRLLAHSGFLAGWEKQSFEGHSGVVNSVSLDPSGTSALSGSSDRTLRLWDITTGKCSRTFEGHKDKVSSVSWSPDGHCALSGSWDQTLQSWEIPYWDSTMHLWERRMGRWQRTFEAHTDKVNSVSLSPDGCFALSGSSDNTLRLWEVASGICRQVFNGHTGKVSSVTWSPDGRFALTGCYDMSLRLWDVSSGKCIRFFAGHTNAVSSVSLSPNGRFALSGGFDNSIRLWNLSSDNCVGSFDGHTGNVSSVVWSPDGRYALSGSDDKTMRLWEISNGRCLRIFEGHTDKVNSVSWSADGSFALSGSSDNTLRLWELDWEFELNQPADWDESARHFLTTFMTLNTPFTENFTRSGKATWTEEDFRRLLDRLACAGFGWLRPEGVRRELEKMAASWKGPPELAGP